MRRSEECVAGLDSVFAAATKSPNAAPYIGWPRAACAPCVLGTIGRQAGLDASGALAGFL